MSCDQSVNFRVKFTSSRRYLAQARIAVTVLLAFAVNTTAIFTFLILLAKKIISINPVSNRG